MERQGRCRLVCSRLVGGTVLYCTYLTLLSHWGLPGDTPRGRSGSCRTTTICRSPMCASGREGWTGYCSLDSATAYKRLLLHVAAAMIYRDDLTESTYLLAICTRVTATSNQNLTVARGEISVRGLDRCSSGEEVHVHVASLVSSTDEIGT